MAHVAVLATVAIVAVVVGLPFAIVQISILNTSYFGQMIWQMESERAALSWLRFRAASAALFAAAGAAGSFPGR